MNKTQTLSLKVIGYRIFSIFIIPTKIKAWQPIKGSHEIRRRLFLRRKAMTNLDSVLKSRDITLLIKVHIVKATVFTVVTYGL